MTSYGAAGAATATPPTEQSEADKAAVKRYLERHALLKARRSQWESHWQECMDYIIPRKSDVISTRQPGDRRNDDLFDTTAGHSNGLLSGALHGMLTSPTQQFFQLIMGDPALDEDEEVREWLQIVGDRMFVVMNNSNFQTEIHEIYIDLGAIGTACLYIDENEKSVVHFSARAMKEIYLDEDSSGLVDTVHREFTWKPRQVVQEFGEKNLHPWIVQKWKEGCDDDWKIIHCVHPKEDGDEETKSIHKYKSVYILVEQGYFLSKDGFREFPYAVPRWTKTSGEIYGRGPGMEMLPDIKMVNAMMETTLKGAQKAVDPPLAVQDDGVIGRVRLTPGGLTVVRPGLEKAVQPLIGDTRVDFGIEMVRLVQSQIRSGFYVDQLQLKDGPQMTAMEVTTRVEQMLRLMGPVIGRQYFEFLRPTIGRVYPIMARKGMFPPAPAKLKGKAFDVRYSSLVARAQRMNEAQNLSRGIAVIAPIANAMPEVMDNINGDKAIRYALGDLMGWPQRLFNNERDMKTKRDARAQAQAEVAEQQRQQHEADVASKVGPSAAQLQQAVQE